MQLEIRRMSERDRDPVIDVWRAAGLRIRPDGRDSPEAFARQMEAGRQTILGLYSGGELVGTALATHDGRKGRINRVAVLPDHRRQGHARKLIAEAELVLRAEGIEVIAILIEAENEASTRLFEAAGYENAADSIVYLSKRDREEA